MPDGETTYSRGALRWVLAVTGVAVLVLAAVLMFYAASSSSSWGWGMMGGWNAGWGWAMGFMMLVPLSIVLVLLFLLLRPTSPEASIAGAVGSQDPLTVLKLRYARGEITQEQYDLMTRRLEGR